MEPKLPTPNHGPELPPLNFGQNMEQSPPSVSPERRSEGQYERLEQRAEGSIAASHAQILPPPVLPAALPAAQDDVAQVVVVDTAMPLVASDDDLIEKEWVDKAKKIILQTKDDPFRREQEVGKLQADYLRKRYGREIGVSQ